MPLLGQVWCSQIFSLCGLAWAIKMPTTAALTHVDSLLEYQTKSHFSATDLSCLLVEGHQCLSCSFDRQLETHVQPTVVSKNTNYLDLVTECSCLTCSQVLWNWHSAWKIAAKAPTLNMQQQEVICGFMTLTSVAHFDLPGTWIPSPYLLIGPSVLPKQDHSVKWSVVIPALFLFVFYCLIRSLNIRQF